MISFAPEIDYSRIPWPTDRLTIGHLRARYPHEFPARGLVTFFMSSNGSTDVAATMELERKLAKHSFDAVLGRNSHPDAEDRDELEEALADQYQYLRFAQGENHAAQMVRDLVTAAESQAKAHLGRLK